MSTVELAINRHSDDTPAAPQLQFPQSMTLHIDVAALRERGLLPPEQRERLLAGQYRQIKRPLIANARGKGVPLTGHRQVIMVASALPGEGKTFTSINLAMSMAREKDTDVILIDGDVAKPHITSVLGVDQQPGLLECLEDETLDTESLVLPTDIPGLSFLPAGTHSDTATELLASFRMLQVVNQLSQVSNRRLILIDSPPLLLTSEARVLAGIAGQVVLVVRAGSTPQKAVLDAISHMDEDKWIGLVLNQSKNYREDRYYYGYEHDYDYGSMVKKRPSDDVESVPR